MKSKSNGVSFLSKEEASVIRSLRLGNGVFLTKKEIDGILRAAYPFSTEQERGSVLYGTLEKRGTAE